MGVNRPCGRLTSGSGVEECSQKTPAAFPNPKFSGGPGLRGDRQGDPSQEMPMPLKALCFFFVLRGGGGGGL